jgi:hypothetical protein
MRNTVPMSYTGVPATSPARRSRSPESAVTLPECPVTIPESAVTFVRNTQMMCAMLRSGWQRRVMGLHRSCNWIAYGLAQNFLAKLKMQE